MALYLPRDEWRCVSTELGELFAMDITTVAATGTSRMLLLCAASWDIKSEASLWIIVIVIVCIPKQ